MNNKSQITAFVILGLVIVILAGLALFLRAQSNKTPRPISVDKEMEPLKQAIEECLYLAAKDGLIKIGMQGGYTDSRTFHLSPNPVSPTNGNSFLFSPDFNPDSQVIIPYWSYMSSDNSCKTSCEFSSQRPSLPRRAGGTSIESQLDNYIKTTSAPCIATAKESFKEKGYDITAQGDSSFQTTITESNVIVDLTQYLKISQGENTYTLSQYRTEIDLNFKKIYDLATTTLITLSNDQALYFEKATLEFIAPFALTPESDLPPIAQTIESDLTGGKMWTKPQVKEKIKEILENNIGNIQVQGSRNNRIPLVINDPVKQAYYNMYFFSLDTPTVKPDVTTLDFQFNYLPWWDSYIDVRPSNGAVIQPESMKTFFPFPIAFQKYIFYYDISYPVLIQIHDPTAFFGEGYTFQFGYEVNIRNSAPIGGNIELLEIPPQTTSLFCDENQRTSGSIIITSKLFGTNTFIDKVDLAYTCTKEACDLGKTAFSGTTAKLETTLPPCLDGRISPSKEGYFGHAKLFSAQAGQGGTADVTVEPFVNTTVYFKKLSIGKTIENVPGGMFIGIWGLLPDRGLFDLSFDEWAILTLTRIPEPGEDEYTQVVIFHWNETPKEIPLVTGSYKVEVQLFKDLGPGRAVEKIEFPAKEYCGGGVLGIGDTCTTVGPMTFNDTFILGTLTIDETNPFNITTITNNLTIIIPALQLEDRGLPTITDFEDVKALELTNIVISQGTNETLVNVTRPRVGNLPPT